MTTHNPYAITAHEDACTALAFARSHDWGRLADLRQDSKGVWFVTRLVDAYTLNGLYHEEMVAVPATIKDMREFGGY